MRRMFFRIAITGGLLILSGCATLTELFTQYGRNYSQAQKSHNRGDYDEAVYKCVASLRANPNYEKAILLLKEAAPLAYRRHQERARGYESRDRWDEAVAEYDAIIRLVGSVSSLRGTFPTVSVEDKREAVAQNAAEAHYKRGISLMKSGRFKEAAIEFRKTQDFVPGYKDSRTLYQKTRREAVRRIAVMPFEDVTGKSLQFGNMGVFLTSQIISAALETSPEFLEFVTRDYLQEILREQQMTITDVFDQSSAVEIGNLLGIHTFVFLERFYLS